jgi:hypothetical protein
LIFIPSSGAKIRFPDTTATGFTVLSKKSDEGGMSANKRSRSQGKYAFYFHVTNHFSLLVLASNLAG